MKNYSIGIDPGKSGGISLIDCETHKAAAYKMPETDLDLLHLFYKLRDECSGGRVKALLEFVHSMPAQGVASSFTFGEGYGKLKMGLAAAGIPWDRVIPTKWQTEMGCLTHGDKNISKARAQQLFPDMKITHALADALLIAEYGRRILAGEINRVKAK